MHELAVPSVDSHVRNPASIGMEEHEIARLKLAFADRGAESCLRGGRMGEMNPVSREHIPGKAGAVEAASAGASAAISIASARQRHLNQVSLTG